MEKNNPILDHLPRLIISLLMNSSHQHRRLWAVVSTVSPRCIDVEELRIQFERRP